MKKLVLTYYGNPILRKRADEVKEVNDEIRTIVQEMDKMMEKYQGVGLAAPQVGLSIRLFILRTEDEDAQGNITMGPLEVYINPKISNLSEKQIPFREGCLSIPGIKSEVVRPETLTIEALDINGNSFTKECDGLRARIIMHENDHLNGVLFIDRLPKKERDSLDPFLRELKKKYSK